jgi:hypothetical protein
MYHNSLTKPVTAAQVRVLGEMGLDPSSIRTSYDAYQLIRAHYAKWASLPATAKQEWLLRQTGQWKDGMDRGEAAELIARIKQQ